jgi:hypothetical protein
VAIGGRFDRPAAAAGGERRSFLVVEKDDIEIAGIVHLPAAELAHREHHRPGQTPAHHRLTESLHEHRLLGVDDPPQDDLGDRGQRRSGRIDVEQAEHVANPDPQLLGGLEGMEHRCDVGRIPTDLLERRLEGLESRQSLDDEAVEQLVDHARIRHQQAGEKLARGADPHRQVERRVARAQQFPENPLAAERVADRRQARERGVGVGGAADRGQQTRGDRSQKMTAPSRGKKPHLLLAKRLSIARCAAVDDRGNRAATTLRRTNASGGDGSSTRSIFRLGLSILRKGIVQQVVEDAAIQRPSPRRVLFAADRRRCRSPVP